MHELNKIADKIKNADAILVGSSNGLSITEGRHLFADNQALEDLFGDFKRKYGIRSTLHGMRARWPSEEEKWAFWSRLIHHYCGEYKESQVMKDLKAIVGDKNYFVITSNGECHFEMSGFAPENIYEVEGNWLTMQCSMPAMAHCIRVLKLQKKWQQQKRTEKCRRIWFHIVQSAAVPCRSIWKLTGIISGRVQGRNAFRHS